MSLNEWLARASTAALGAVLISTPAWGQAAASAAAQNPEQATGLDEVVVTARRVEENQQTVPVAVTILSGDALARRNVQQVTDLQFSVPNLQIKQSNTYSSLPEFIIRGQRQTLFTDENVVTYVDGVPQSTRGLTLYDLDSVQVLKGPQGTLFGKNSNGGAVVVTTKKPVFDFDSRLDVDLGNYDLRRVTGMINLPLVADKLALRVDGQLERRDGVFKNAFPGSKDAGDLHNESGRMSLRFIPTDRLDSLTVVDGIHRNEIPTPSIIEAAPLNNTGFGALLSTLTQQAVTQQSALGGGTPVTQGGLLVRQGDPFRVNLPTGLGATVPSGHYNPIAGLASVVDVWGVGNNTSYDLNDQLTLRNIFGYRYERAVDQQDPAGVAGFTLNVAPALAGLGVPGLPSFVPGNLVDNNTNFVNKFKTVTEELQLVGKLPHANFIVGGFYSHVDHLYSVGSNFTVGPVDLYQVGPRYGEDRITASTGAIFGQGTFDLGAFGLNGLSLTGGVRYTWDDRSYRASNFYTNGDQDVPQAFKPGDICNEVNGSGASGTGVNTPTQCYLSGGREYKAPTWTVSLDYQFNPDTMAYFTNRRGFKAGSSNPTTVNHDFALYGSEYLTDYEVGLKNEGHIFGAPYRFNIDAFLGKYRDIQTGDVLTFCATAACTGTYTDLVIFNVGHAEIKGLEIDGALKPTRSVEFDLGYSYQVAKYGDGSVIPQPTHAGPIGVGNPIDFTGGENLSGLDFPGVPRHNLSLAANFNLDFIPKSIADATFNINYAYRSKTVGNTALGVYPTPAYGVANLRLAFQDLFGSQLSAAFWMSNIANKAYPLSCADNLASLGYATCRWGEPRTFGVTATGRFH